MWIDGSPLQIVSVTKENAVLGILFLPQKTCAAYEGERGNVRLLQGLLLKEMADSLHFGMY